MLKEEGIAERTWILSFDWRNLVHIQKTAPELSTVYLTIVTPGSNTLKLNQPGASPWMAGLDVDDFNGSAPRAVKAAGGRIWSPYFKNLTPESLAEARQLGLKISVWTPDRPEDLKQMIDMKVDAITTNRPDVLKNLLR
jgi:glycerophosphoryl diester phosphodiesterase